MPTSRLRKSAEASAKGKGPGSRTHHFASPEMNTTQGPRGPGGLGQARHVSSRTTGRAVSSVDWDVALSELRRQGASSRGTRVCGVFHVGEGGLG